jgi:hypothetical protein
MDKTFNPSEYVTSLALELVDNFARANRGTTPHLVGSAKEKAVRDKLASLLPSFVGVGTGCIIDTFGNTSKQCDLVIYEKDFCPIFSINDNPDSTYFPCESVIAIGEIKTSLNTEQLTDSFSKVKSVKSLKRFSAPFSKGTIGGFEFRHYGSKMIITGVESEAYDQTLKHYDQIYSFILSEDIILNLDTFLTKYVELVRLSESHLLPNLTLSLKDGLFLYYDKNKNQFNVSKTGATTVFNAKTGSRDFHYLLNRLTEVIYHGRTTNVFPFKQYINPNDRLPLNGLSKDL